MALCLSADAALYRLEKKYLKLPWLISGPVYRFTVRVDCIDEGARVPGDIRVIVIQHAERCPLLTASLPMPISHIENEIFP